MHVFKMLNISVLSLVESRVSSCYTIKEVFQCHMCDKNGNFPFAIIFHFHERDFQPPPIDQQRPSTTMRSMLQCNVESMLTVPEELAYPAKVDSGTRSVPISSDIDLDHVDSSPTSSVEEPDTLPTSRAQNKCGICRKPGHTRRNCSLKEKKAKRPRR
ncbi:hypothetical protein GEMRC1_014183 [Eukaryota sp. GEM-RC1]